MKIIGQCVVGPGEADKYLKETLDEFKRLCDDAVIATCNAGIKEKRLIKKYGFWQYEDNREWGIDQPNIKTDLLKKIIKLNPDWILVLDADETVPTVKRNDLKQMADNRESCYFFIVDLWNDNKHYSKALSFWNVRFYKPNSARGLQFLRKNLHCGNAPPYYYTLSAKSSYVPHILLHKGLMNPKDRLKKVERYNIYDPNAVFKGRDYYDALLDIGNKAEYNQDEVQTKLINFCKTL